MPNPVNTPAIQAASSVPLTSPQNEIWSDQILNRDSPRYNIGGYMRIAGIIDPARFEEAVRQLVRKHDVLRTVLDVDPEGDDLPLQSFAPEMSVVVPFLDLSTEPAPRQAALDWMRRRFAEPFALSGEPLFRYALLKLGADSFYAFVCYHHLIADGWSVALLARSVAAIYTALDTGMDADLCAPSYLDFVANDRAYVASPAFDAQRAYWLDKFRPAPEPLLVARRALAQVDGDSPGKCSTLTLSREWYDRVHALARQYGGTTFHAILAALYVYFTRTAQRDALTIGLPVLNRANATFKATAGLFVGVTATRFRFGTQLAFSELLHAIGRELKQNYRHQRFPVSLLNRAANRIGGEQPQFFGQLFDISLSYERHAYEAAFGQARGIAIPLANEHLAHPLTMYVREFHDDEPVQLDFVYHKAYFDEAEIQALQQRLLRILDDALEAPDTPVRDMSLLVPDEALRISDWNNTERAYDACDGNAALLDKFDAQVRLHGERTAVVVEGSEISYRELDTRANRLARFLRIRHGIAPDVLVGLFMDRSIEMIVGILGVLKAGAAYLPLDPAYPAERLLRTLEDAAPAVLLSRQRLADRLPPSPAPVVFLDSGWDEIATHAADAVPSIAAADNLAYVIYTSGSTGNPKGVAVSRANLLHLMRAQDAYFPDPVERFLMTWSFAFDGSVFCIFWTLFGGGTLFLATEREHNDVEAVVRLIENHAITHLLAIPSFHALLLDTAEPWQLASLSTVMVAGEACGADLVRQHFAKLPQAGLLNGYGPTEGSVWSTVHACEPGQDFESVPIGRPIENVQVRILDPFLEPLPVGVPGDIYISGEGVTRGYLRNPGLTADRFLPCPFSAQPGARMYKTGDLGRWTPEGHLEFLGRTDHQVKVRGFRIELTDVEAALLAQASVREAAVLLREETPGDQRLAAYVVLHEHAIARLTHGDRMMREPGAQPLDDVLPGLLATKAARMLKEALARTLPQHMMPHHIVLLKDMPHTPNGKVDRKALSSLRADHASAEYVPPATPTETILAGLWAALLKVERVGRHDNFFDLGGHSLLAVTLIQRMRKHGLHAEVRTLFTAPTLAELAAATHASDSAIPVPANGIPPHCTAIEPAMLPLVTLKQTEIDRIVAAVPGGAANVQDIYPLGPQQEGLLLHRLAVDEGDAFSLRALFAADAPERFAPMLQALQAVVERHDVLRTVVLWEGLPEPVQVVLRQARPLVETMELDSADGDIAGQLMRRFDTGRFRLDVRQAPMLRLTLARDTANGRWLMLLLSHHLVLDHTSLDLLREELHAHMTGRADALPAPTQYRDYVAQTRLAARRAQHEEFFRRMLGDVDQPTHPFGLQDVLGNGGALRESRREVDTALAARLRKQARELGVSVASLCHLAWALVLARTAGRDDVVFGTVLFGRLHGQGVDRAMGLFINTLPVRIRLGRLGVAELAREVHALLAALLEHEHAPLSLAQRCSAVPAPTPLFSALLNYRYSDKNGATPGAQAWPGVRLLSGVERSNYPFALSIDDFGNDLALTAQTAAAIGTEGAEGPERLCGFMHAALEHLALALEDAPAMPAYAVDVLPPQEWATLQSFHEAARSGPQIKTVLKTVQQLFEEQVLRTPQAMAVIHQDERLSYAELNTAANRLAHYLIGLGVGPDRRVAVCLERSAEMIVALLAILKAGGAYVPLDPAYPRERLASMLEDAAPTVLVTRRGLRERLPAATNILCLDGAGAALSACATHDPRPALLPDHLAYVLYTSGSTGQPKGVMVRHGGLADLARFQATRLRAQGCRVALQFASISFDMAAEDIFSTLICGACLVVRPASLLAPNAAFLHLLDAHRVDALNLPTAFWHAWVQRLDAGESTIPESVRLVAVGGEKVGIAHYRRWTTHTAGRQGTWSNTYGPTETTITATVLDLPFADGGKRDEIPIGRPLPYTRVHILDAYLNPVPVGVAGELHIAGSALARGYLGRPDLTAEKFIPDPFSKTPGARLYKSGDLARYRPDGSIEFLGRIDHQVKLRGFRIEPGEIETALAAHPAVREAVVVLREDDGLARLVAYVTHKSPIDAAALRAHLASRLPDYMLPAAYVPLDALPLSPIGKLNRQALPAPDSICDVTGAFEAPQGEMEETLARIWCELLNREQVSRHDNFFELGGHSLLAARMMARIQEAVGRALPLSQLFRSPSIAQLAAELKGKECSGQLTVPLRPGTPGTTPLWLLHPAGGTVHRYRKLAARLPGGRPVYAIQSPEIAGHDVPEPDFDSLCRRYLAEIMQAQPDGPVHLAGWSMGGALAFRIAELLEEKGRHVGWVGIIDTLLRDRPQAPTFAQFLASAMTHVPAEASQPDMVLEDLDVEAARNRLLAYIALQEEEHLQQGLNSGAARAAGELADQPLPGFLQRQYELHRRHAQWLAGFVPGMIDAPLHVFMAEASMQAETAATDWLRHTRQAPASTVRILPGNHENAILLETNIDDIVRILTRTNAVIESAST
jgi:amino acid adenylation domain-containing protein